MFGVSELFITVICYKQLFFTVMLTFEIYRGRNIPDGVPEYRQLCGRDYVR